jgi:outer membrane protein
MKFIKQSGLLIGVFISVVLSAITLFVSPGKQKLAYVRMEAVYNSFSMKSQLEGKLKATEKARQFIIDSLKLQMHQLTLTLQAQPKVDTSLLRLYNLKQNYLQNQEASFDEDNQALAKEYSDQIWTQINQYAGDFGKSNGYDYILGASGDGTLMYANESKDVTEELKVYINTKYQGSTR